MNSRTEIDVQQFGRNVTPLSAFQFSVPPNNTTNGDDRNINKIHVRLMFKLSKTKNCHHRGSSCTAVLVTRTETVFPISLCHRPSPPHGS